MPTIVAPSAAGIMPFYADYSGPAKSESQAAFIDHKQPKRAAVSCSHSHSAILPVHTAQFSPSQVVSYRGSGVPRPATAPAAPPTARAGMLAEIEALSARVSALQGKLASAGVVAPTPLEVQLGEVSAKLAAIEQAGLKIGGAVPTYLDTCSKFAAEASRVRNAGRLPFGSDHSKIA